MSGLFDIVNRPLVVLQSMFDQQGKLDPATVSEYVMKELEKPSLISQVRSLNCTPLHDLKPNSLVRYRCMIQDMFDPEFYLGAYEVEDSCSKHTFLKSGMYRDVAECKTQETIMVDSSRNILLDRQKLYCVPIPAETQWVKQAEHQISRPSMEEQNDSQTGKRGLDDDNVDEDMATDSTSKVPSNSSDQNTTMETDNEEGKRSRQESHQVPRKTSQLPDLNFPLPNETGPACLVKLYNKVDEFKVNEMLEVIGVLSIDPSMASDSTSGSTNSTAEDEMDDDTSNEPNLPPPSLVPRLHAVLVKKLEHNNPWLADHVDRSQREKILREVGEDIETLRRRLLEILQQVTLGDNLAAEYLLCHLVSSVYFSAGLLPIGKLSLNLSQVPKSEGYVRLVYMFISSLVTKSYMLPLSLHCLNKGKFTSQKDYSSNRLKSGMLQLSKQTNLILDETQLEAGQLNVEGHKNIKTLENVIRWQKIQYDFGFYQREFEANVEILCLSEGKSILPADVHVPLNISVTYKDLDNYFSRLGNELTPNLLKKFQIYLGLVKTMEYTVDKEFELFIQNDFITMRQNDSKSMSEDDLHSLLNLTRLLTMSRGLAGPTAEVWQWAKTLQSSCKQRIQQQTNSLNH